MVDAYNSRPDDFEGEASAEQGGDAGLLCATLGEGSAGEVEALLRGSRDFVFAVELHMKLAEALKLPDCSIGYGFVYVEGGDLEDETIEGDLIQVGA